MLIIIEILFCVFGIVFNKNGLLITVLALSGYGLLLTLYLIGKKRVIYKFQFFLRTICFALSIIFLVI